MGMNIRQIINVLIDAPDKDKPFIVECRRDELNKCKYEWGQLEISKLTNCGHSSIADAYVRPEDKWWKGKDGWIPTSDNLPEKNEYVNHVCKYYLIQDEYGDMHVAHYTGHGWISIDTFRVIESDVVAWMPLPNVYKSERGCER